MVWLTIWVAIGIDIRWPWLVNFHCCEELLKCGNSHDSGLFWAWVSEKTHTQTWIGFSKKQRNLGVCWLMEYVLLVCVCVPINTNAQSSPMERFLPAPGPKCRWSSFSFGFGHWRHSQKYPGYVWRFKHPKVKKPWTSWSWGVPIGEIASAWQVQALWVFWICSSAWVRHQSWKSQSISANRNPSIDTVNGMKRACTLLILPNISLMVKSKEFVHSLYWTDSMLRSPTTWITFSGTVWPDTCSSHTIQTQVKHWHSPSN